MTALAPSHRPTPLSARITRFARVTTHLTGGLATTVFVFPWIGPAKKKALIRRWEDLPMKAAFAAGIDAFAAAFETDEPSVAMAQWREGRIRPA